MNNDLVLAGAQRRITFVVPVPGSRKPQPFTFWPGRINRCPRAIWESLLTKKGSPRTDGDGPRSPLEEYIETGLLWELTAAQANQIKDGRASLVSPHGPEGRALRPRPREPAPVPGLEHLGEINRAVAEEVALPASVGGR